MRITLIAFVAAAVLSAQPLKSGLDPTSFDTRVRPQDDLYRFVNGKWLETTVIPAHRVSWGAFAELAEQAELDVRRIIETLSGSSSPERQIRDLYASMVNEAKVDALGIAPIRGELARIDAIDSPTALARQIGRLSAMNAGGPFGASAGLDASNLSALLVTVAQGGTLLPERDYYLRSDSAMQAIRDQYIAYLTNIFTLADRPRPGAAARDVLALETLLAQAQQPHADAQIRRPGAPLKLPQAMREMPGFDWQAWAQPQGFDLATRVVFEQPSFFRSFAAAIGTTPLETWKAWLAARYITATSIFISRPFADARFEFFGRVLSGQEIPLERWKRGVSMVNAHLGDAMGRLYVKKHLPETSRDRVEKIVDTIVRSFREAIEEADWMTPGARRAARDKLSHLSAAVGYPSRWRDYDGLRIEPDDLLGNAQRAFEFENSYAMRMLRRRTAGNRWTMPPQSVNAYYVPARNMIVLPAAVLQPPLFDPEADDAVNYGGIGAIAGHEISHAFDARGRRFDGFGLAADWWTGDDERQFQQRARMVVEQFSGYSPMPGRFVNGELTLGENIGDIVGLSIAFRAYRLSLKGKPSPTIDGLSGEQRLFMRWAQIWRGKTRDTYLPQTLFLEQHAPPEYRAHGALVNLDAFHAAFDVQPGDKLYRDPKKRVRIW